jgi:hypothetical protein
MHDALNIIQTESQVGALQGAIGQELQDMRRRKRESCGNGIDGGRRVDRLHDLMGEIPILAHQIEAFMPK